MGERVDFGAGGLFVGAARGDFGLEAITVGAHGFSGLRGFDDFVLEAFAMGDEGGALLLEAGDAGFRGLQEGLALDEAVAGAGEFTEDVEVLAALFLDAGAGLLNLANLRA